MKVHNKNNAPTYHEYHRNRLHDYPTKISTELFSHARCTHKNVKRCTKLTHPAPFGKDIQHQIALTVFTRMQDEVFT